jgi:hypothetical protein
MPTPHEVAEPDQAAARREKGREAAVQREARRRRKRESGGGAGIGGAPSQKETRHRATRFQGESAIVCPN